MSNSEGNTHKRARSLIMRAVLIGGLVGALLSFVVGETANRAVFDSLQRAAPREISTDNVAVVMIDDASVAAAGEWPWQRYRMARLLALIGLAQPKAIGVDIYFTEPDPMRPEAFTSLYLDDELDRATRDQINALPTMDQYLAQILGETPSVLARVATDEPDGRAPDTMFFNPAVEGEAPRDVLRRERVFASIEDLDAWAMAHGMVNGAPDDDGVVRRVPLSVKVGEVQAAGFAAELARIGSDTEMLRWRDGDMLFDQKAVAADAAGNMLFKMGIIPQEAQHSAIDILDGAVPPEALEGKIVLVGVTALGTFDIVATPLNSETYGVLVQAQAVDAIMVDQWLTRGPSTVALELLAALTLFGLIFLAGVSQRNWLLFVAGGLALAVPTASLLAFVQSNLLFYPTIPLIIGLFAATGLWLGRYSITRSERARLAEELIEERVRASEQKGELDAARRIQMSMVPGEKTLGKLDPRVEIGGVLEPAKSVGGDFFDAVKINEDLLLFLVGDVTGKGVPAALFMALSKTLSKSNLARAADGLEEAVAALNFDLMDEADEEMGLTMLVGTIDCSTGALQIVNAGHENPMVVRREGSVETLEMVGGPPLCVINFPYAAESFALAPGETLVIITDGATEAANERGELFGQKGVESALTSHKEASAPDKAVYLASKVRAFEGKSDPSDDLTIFALRWLGPLA